jgi:hypothetical protein
MRSNALLSGGAETTVSCGATMGGAGREKKDIDLTYNQASRFEVILYGCSHYP